MVAGPRKHLKRLCAPKSWMINKTDGVFAPKPIAGPHKPRDSIPLLILLRNRMKYALNYREANIIAHCQLVSVDHKIRTNVKFSAGIMDVIKLDRVKENFRVVYDPKGRFVLHRITEEEANFKLCKVQRKKTLVKGVPSIITTDGRTIRYPDPLIRNNDTIVYDLKEGKIKDFIHFEVGNLCFLTNGRNRGRIGVIISRDRHAGSVDLIRVQDAVGRIFATKLSNVFVIGKGTRAYISLPKGKGIRLTAAEERDKRLALKK